MSRKNIEIEIEDDDEKSLAAVDPKGLSLRDGENVLLAMVRRPDIDPERLEKFMELQFKMEAKQAEREFNIALSAFQGECPIIDKSKNVNFTSNGGKTVDYDYSPLDAIDRIIKPLLKKFKLSYSFNSKELEKDKIELVTKVRHAAGHSESTTYTYNKYHDDARMNLSQRQKAAQTFAKRAALENALGLTTAKDADADDSPADTYSMTKEQLKEIRTLLTETKSDEMKFLDFIKAENLESMSAQQAKVALHTLKQKKAKNVQNK